MRVWLAEPREAVSMIGHGSVRRGRFACPDIGGLAHGSQTPRITGEVECRQRDSNPQSPRGLADFKSAAFTISPCRPVAGLRAEDGGGAVVSVQASGVARCWG